MPHFQELTCGYMIDKHFLFESSCECLQTEESGLKKKSMALEIQVSKYALLNP